jgi:hypothetical protein
MSNFLRVLPFPLTQTVLINFKVGRAITQAVSRWLPTAAAQVRPRSCRVVFVVDEVALGQVFSAYFGLPCQSSFHQTLHPHNHPGQVQQINWWPTCRVDPVGFHRPLFEVKKLITKI